MEAHVVEFVSGNPATVLKLQINGFMSVAMAGVRVLVLAMV